MAAMQKKNLARPDETRKFDKGLLDLVTLGGVTFGRGTFQPGWRWSTSVKPLVNTKSCEAPHLQYHISGRLRVLMDDGSEAEFGPGDVSLLPPGHDAWVVGGEALAVGAAFKQLRSERGMSGAEIKEVLEASISDKPSRRCSRANPARESSRCR